MNENKNLKPGTKVTFDGRAQGPLTGTITKREAMPSYYANHPGIVYYAITGVSLLIPATDIMEVHA